MKKAILTLAIAAALILTLGLSACKTDGRQAEGGKFDELTTAREVYGFSAASAGTLVSAMNGGAAQASLKAMSEVTDQETVDTLNRYMMLVESMLGDGSFGIVAGESDRAEYAVKETVTYRDLLGNPVEYVLYYNETDVTDEDKDAHETEIEKDFDIEGVMVIDGADYAIKGEKETESEEGESESECKFTVTLNETKRLVVKQETETEEGETETEFVYSTYENGEQTERSTFKYEKEDGETELEFTLLKDGNMQIFVFEEENGAIEVKIGGKGGAKNTPCASSRTKTVRITNMKARTARSTKTATERYKRKAETLSFFCKTEEQHALRRAVLLKQMRKNMGSECNLIEWFGKQIRLAEQAVCFEQTLFSLHI